MQSATNDGATLRVATTAHHVNAPIDSSITTPYTDVKRKSVPVQNPPDDLESCIREAFNAAVLLGRRAVAEAWRCGYLLTEARRTADRRDGGFRGVLARADIPLRTAYRLIELYERYPKCANLAHFTSVDRALAAARPTRRRSWLSLAPSLASSQTARPWWTRRSRTYPRW